jgi:GNAT superfamily N-acetyltransferase
MLDGLRIDELTTDAQVMAAFPLMAELRDRVKRDTFLEEIRVQETEGYRLLGLYAGDILVCIAGVRRQHTTSRGPHAFVDDLVTHPDHRGKGYATELLKYVAVQAAANGLPRVYLDARATALGFYDKLKFKMLTSVPCWIEAEALRNASGK